MSRVALLALLAQYVGAWKFEDGPGRSWEVPHASFAVLVERRCHRLILRRDSSCATLALAGARRQAENRLSRGHVQLALVDGCARGPARGLLWRRRHCISSSVFGCSVVGREGDDRRLAGGRGGGLCSSTFCSSCATTRCGDSTPSLAGPSDLSRGGRLAIGDR